MKVTSKTFLKSKKENKKLTMLTAYDYTTAKLIDEAGIDAILVGDSLGMVMLGYENTLSVTVEDMIYHTKAVKRGVKNALVVTDMPFMSYHISVEESIKNAGRLVKEGGAEAIKIEGGKEVVPQIKGIINAGIPVMGHLGLTPQSIHKLGGYKIQGKNLDEAKKLIEDAYILQEAGVFSIVLECVPYPIAEHIAKKLDIPIIGIGAGKGVDGQVLVCFDLFGMYEDIRPKFVKQYLNMGEKIKEGVKKYIEEVRQGIFPEEKHSYNMDKNILEKIIKN
ncbi:3-methyl-2-oxobutanoate hydroxymethyltransferase [Defluviitalea phaphyphila]|uniref:3-methyl-2-oxobutanoate hydroxymethyltransferase n=1 Tax=Defluviitalea phaphyphila TaxID=1473580 RepID=UPI000731B3C5|nr:3-methyl-2-oxobutanoate hydroxymethyltransferase [Defluviitalea phaphyphila]